MGKVLSKSGKTNKSGDNPVKDENPETLDSSIKETQQISPNSEALSEQKLTKTVGDSKGLDVEDEKKYVTNSKGESDQLLVKNLVSSKIENTDRKESSIPVKKLIELPKVREKLRDVIWTGKIIQEEGTDFWGIELNDGWQNIREDLVKLVKDEDLDTDDLETATNKAEEWKKELKSEWLEKLGSEAIDFFAPTGGFGLHISLGKILPEQMPECVVKGKAISFKYKSFSTVATNWKHPKIIPGQLKISHPKGDNYNPLLHCPTQWYLLEVEVEDFDFAFKLSPHVSIACYGLMYVPKADIERTYKGHSDYEYGKLPDEST